MNTINIGLFGFGTVGQGIYKVIGRAANAHAEIKRICVRNLSKPRAVEVPAGLLTDNENDILDDPSINLIVEVVDNAEASYRIVTSALKRGVPVVSGNHDSAPSSGINRTATPIRHRTAVRCIVVRFHTCDTKPRGILRQRPAA